MALEPSVPPIKVEGDFACRPAERDGDPKGEGAQRGEKGSMDGQPRWPRVGKTGQLPHPLLVQGALS